MSELTSENLKEWLKPLQDPEIRMGLVDLGLIYQLDVVDLAAGKVDCVMTLTTPTCPAADYMVSQVKNRILEYPGVKDATVKLVFEPKWNPKTMASEEAKEKMGIW